jgi:hypothetical protein
MGLEPTTFCMAKASDVRARAPAIEPERTPSLAILVTPRPGARGGLERRSVTAHGFSELRRLLIAFDEVEDWRALGCFRDAHRLRVQQAAVGQEPSLRVVGAILYRKEAWSTTRPNCGSTGWVFTRAETKS